MPNCYECPKHAEVMRLRARLAAMESEKEMQMMGKKLEEVERGNTAGKNQSAAHPVSVTQYLMRIDKLQKALEETRQREEREKERADKNEQTIHSLQKKLRQEKEAREKKELENESCLLKKLEAQKKRLDKKYNKVTEALRAEIEKKDQEIADLKDLIHGESEIDEARTVTVNSQNSSMPPSQDPNHKTIVSNHRNRSGKPIGGQTGHEHHPRRWFKPNHIVQLETPDEVLANPDAYYATGKVIRKQQIGMKLKIDVTEYRATEYRQRETLRRVHGSFPEHLGHLESNYAPSMEAVVCWLHSIGNMSYGKISELMSDVSNGQLKMSEGCMVNLEARYANATEEDRAIIQRNMLRDAVWNMDGTFQRVNGKLFNVLILRSKSGVSYFATGCKGKKALEQSFADQYHGCVVADGETTFHRVGDSLQRCLFHVSRYLKGATMNEPWLTFPTKMRDFLWATIDRRDEEAEKGLQRMDPQEYEKVCREYDELIELGRREYEEHPPKKNYRKGYTTWMDLAEHRDQFLLFLTDYRITPHNNDAEKSARALKVHSKINGGLRSEAAADHHAKTMTVLESHRIQNPRSSLIAKLVSGMKKAKALIIKRQNKPDAEMDMCGKIPDPC